MGGSLLATVDRDWHDARMPERVYTTPLLDKLGVKPDARVAILNLEAPWFEDLLRERTVDIQHGRPKPDTDLVFLGADVPPDLECLADLRTRIRPNGAIWVISRKGKAATLRDVDVIEATLAAGMVDNKVVSFSDTQTALRAVIRIRDRPATSRR
jgi:hypothetical protein